MEENWVCHVIGSDDVIPCDSEIVALRLANGINKEVTQIERKEYDAIVIAVAKDLNSDNNDLTQKPID